MGLYKSQTERDTDMIKCDICEKQVSRWFDLNIDINAQYDWINVSDMLKYRKKMQVCLDCLKRFCEEQKYKVVL